MTALIECGDPTHTHSGPCTVHPDRPVCGDRQHRHSGRCETYALDPRPRLVIHCGCGLRYGTARGVTAPPVTCPVCGCDWSSAAVSAPTADTAQEGTPDV